MNAKKFQTTAATLSGILTMSLHHIHISVLRRVSITAATVLCPF